MFNGTEDKLIVSRWCCGYVCNRKFVFVLEDFVPQIVIRRPWPTSWA